MESDDTQKPNDAEAVTTASAEPTTVEAPAEKREAAPVAAAPAVVATEAAAPGVVTHEEPTHAEAAPMQAEAATGTDEAAVDQPGDDIGNRAPGEGPPDDVGNHAQGAAGAKTGESPSKKRRRRRKKKHAAEGAPGAEGAALGAEGEADDAASAEGGEGEVREGEEAEGGEGQPGDKPRRRHRGGPAQLRDRPSFSIGEEVFGRVSKVTDAAVWIDIAGKATGLFDRRELADDEPPPAEGDQFIATVASAGVRGGMLMLSRLPIMLDESKKVVEAALGTGEQLTGFVTGAVKGGLEVDFGGLRAFAPASHVDLRHGADLEYLVGQRLDFVVTQYAKKGRDIVVSRRKILEEESNKVRAEALSKVEAGSIQKGIVRKVVAWGVFVALPEANGVEGLVHMTEASHDRGAKLFDLFKPGDEIEVKVLRVDEKGKLWLSRKAVTSDPWDQVKEKYAVGSRHKGTVARLQPFGAFVELEPGIDGLVHTADLTMKQIEHPSEVVKIGDEIEVVVAGCEVATRRIRLHPAPPPGEEAEPRQRLAPHKAVKVVVAQVMEAGLVVRVMGVTGRGARGFIPAGHTGTARGSDLRKAFPLGTQLEAKVLEIDPRRGEAKLSIRALKEDIEKAAFAQYRAGVARESKFGTFADLMKKH